MERTMDLIARTLGLEPTEVRRRNMIHPKELPCAWACPIATASRSSTTAATSPAPWTRPCRRSAALPAFRERQREAKRLGRCLGLGVASYVEGTGVGPFESALVRIESNGSITVSSGACSQGQGMETIFAQVVADLWSVDPDDVAIALGDTVADRHRLRHDRQPQHRDLRRHPSRQRAAASQGVRHRRQHDGMRTGRPRAAPRQGRRRRRSGMEVTLAAVAQAARPGWDHRRPAGVDAGLEETFYWEPPTVTWSNATHLALVDVDIVSGAIAIERYVVAHDCGVVINPMLVDGQVVGGTVQGLGGALFEEFVYDRQGQLLTGSLMDYALPRATTCQAWNCCTRNRRRSLNPLGVKGVGEGGAIAPPAAVANAICDALAAYEIEINATPIKPEHIVRAVAAVDNTSVHAPLPR